MSITVRKVTITTTETHQTWSREKIMKRLATYMATLPGCSISHPLTTDDHRFVVILNLNGGQTDQFILGMFGSNSSPTAYEGLCENGYDPDITSTSYNNRPKFCYNFTLMKQNVVDYHDFYFFISDNKLICFSDPLAGFMVFKHEAEGLKTFYQTRTIVPDWTSTGGTGGGSIMATGISTDHTFDLVVMNKTSGACGQVGISRNTCLIGTSYHMPSNKLLKYSKIESDIRWAVESEVSDYPVNMAGDLLLTYSGFSYGEADVGATYKKVQVDGKNYMHIGGAAWMPYDTITETTISAD